MNKKYKYDCKEQLYKYSTKQKCCNHDHAILEMTHCLNFTELHRIKIIVWKNTLPDSNN